MQTRRTPWAAGQPRRLVTALANRLHQQESRERGDVPGWVLITLMTAGLVTLLWGIAGTELETLFRNAIRNVAGPGGG